MYSWRQTQPDPAGRSLLLLAFKNEKGAREELLTPHAEPCREAKVRGLDFVLNVMTDSKSLLFHECIEERLSVPLLL